MTDEQLISGAQALLDLDARGALVPHGIGGHARTIIEGFLALSRRVPASGDEYVPCIIRNDSAGFYEFVTEDVPALYGGMMAANVERIGKLQGGDLIGFRIYDETPIPEGKAEPGEAAVIVTESMVEAFMAEFQRQGIAMDDFSPPIYPARLIEAALSALGEQP